MFRRSERGCAAPRQVTVWLDGQPCQVPDTLSVAAAVLHLHGWQGYRRHHDGSTRAPLCMMGVCQECLISIDGRPNRQGCLEPVYEGMRIERQQGERHAD
ncbi:2Fe-2S iron-sulfur cluster binding domain-containing protein [Modicisalibacter muralis]|uniref:2Fe-2S iron-sulfur cluster binding domain-containing protein n=1 Tax=Modicisalibacter muralis TaxID=119000 RepID=A0A1G9IDH4_9GAMM|nr:(2Fe-2S)-binding protein [Halomonas muralis]SDL23281.1 2Fe-2S iron-sulfur cluster binding domain-containing protein [Halomonas muralis]